MTARQQKSGARKMFSIDTTDKATRRIIAPYVKMVRKYALDKTKESEKFSFYLKNKPSVLMQDFSKFLSDSMDLASVLLESAEVLKMITKANGVTLYMVDSASEEIYQVPKNVAEDSCQKINFKIQKGTTLAAHVAFEKEYVMIDDILCDERFPCGLGYPDDMIKSVLCVPIVTTEGDCYALLEMYRNVTEQPFTKDDLKISIVVSGWMGAAIHQNRLRLALQKQQELNDYLLDLTKCYFADNVPLEKLITEIVKFAKATLGAERGSFFIIDPESDDMVAEVFDEGLDANSANLTMHRKNIKVRLSKDRSIPGLVARTGVTVNIRDAYNDPRFFTPVEPKTGLITRSILCMPIVSVDNILGVVQVVNKMNGVVFTGSDENLFKTFSVYCALALHYARILTKLRRTERLNESNEILLGLQMKPCIHDIETFLKQPETIVPSTFDDFRWYVSPDEFPQTPQLTLYMVEKVVTFKDVNVELLMQFILTVRKCYRNNPYHNWEHAFNVAHCMYNLLLRNLDLFNDIEIKALLIATLCHDLDHGGYTNNYLQLTDDTLAQLYDESFLENHHYRVSMKIYSTCPFYNIPEESFRKVCKEMKDIILASDLTNHFKTRMKFIKVHNETSDGFDWDNRHHKQICKDLMMTTCDLSGVCKPFMVAKNIVDNVYKEYYNQGDKEKAMGLTPLSLMDRDKSAVIPEDQVQFINVIVLPCTEMLKELLPNCEELNRECLLLKKTWQEIIDLKGQKSWRHNDSVVNQIE